MEEVTLGGSAGRRKYIWMMEAPQTPWRCQDCEGRPTTGQGERGSNVHSEGGLERSEFANSHEDA